MGTQDQSKGSRRRRGSRQASKSRESASFGGNDDDFNLNKQQQQQQQQSLLIQLTDESPTWYQYGEQYPMRNATIESKELSVNKRRATSTDSADQRNSAQIVAKYRAMADALYRREVQLFNEKSKNSTSADERWVESTMKRGTLKDRIAAMSVTASTDPIHKLYALDSLLQMATGSSATMDLSRRTSGNTNSRVAQLASEALEDLFLHTYLPSDRKLVTLAHRPLYLYEQQQGREENECTTSSDNSKKGLEKKLKSKKSSSSSAAKRDLSPRVLLLWRFEEMIKDKFHIFVRQYIAKTLHEGKSTGTLEVDKILAIRSAANLLRSVPECEQLLLQLIVNKLGDPAKKVAAAAGRELRNVLRQHPAMQTIIAREVQQLVHRPHLSSRALYNCIIFLNQLKLEKSDRADGGADSNDADHRALRKKKSQTDSLPASLISTYFGLFEVAVRGGTEENSNLGNSDGFSSGMKTRLLSALLTGVNRAHPYLPRKDQSLDEHIDALYRVVHTAPASARTQALLLLFHVTVGSEGDDCQQKAGIKRSEDDRPGFELRNEDLKRRARFYRALYSSLSNPSLLGGGKHLTMYFNLLYKAMKYDFDTSRVIAFAKRIMSMALHCSPTSASACIFLLNEISRTHLPLKSCLRDVLRGPDASRMVDSTKLEPLGALLAQAEESEEREKKIPIWELSLFGHHYHPSVCKFSCDVGGISYTGDPLKDFGLAPFLDKFAYRNPKSAERVAAKFKRGESIAERKSGTGSVIQSQFSVPVNDPSFLKRDHVEAQDEFFRRFFAERARRDREQGILRQRSDDADEESDALDEAEAKDVDGKFEYFESQWETDSEEEAFVDSLAQKIIEDALDVNGPADLDEEDPDMDDWDDLRVMEKDSPDEANGSESDASSQDGTSAHFLADEDEEGDDAFMEEDFEDDDSDGVYGRDGEVTQQGHLFMREHAVPDDDSSASDDLALLAHSDSDESHRGSQSGPLSTEKKAGRNKESATYAPVEEYADAIEASWRGLQDTSHDAPEDNQRSRKRRRKKV